MIWFVASLIPLTSLMMGAVHPWAFKTMEEVVLALVAVWIVSFAIGKTPLPRIDHKLQLPLGGIILLLLTIAFQLVPLPVQIEKRISPSTYRLYKVSLPGWPDKKPYSWLLESGSDGESIRTRQGSREIPKEKQLGTFEKWAAESQLSRKGPILLPLSVAPSLTKGALLNLLTAFLLGALVVLYPFPNSDHGASDIYQVLVRIILATALLLGFIGLLQEFISNGKPLWIFTPYDFDGRNVWGARAFGPFANPDHYACFLAMLLPPALAGILFPRVLGRVRERAAVPILCGVVAIVIIAALVATGSRGGMLNAVVGVAVLGWLSSRLSPERQPDLFRLKKRKYLILGAGAAGLLALAVYLAGSSNRTLAETRLKAPFDNESIAARFIPAQNTERMISDFPIFGVGLGAWPDLYRKYTRPPWSPVFMNAVHDEYVQLLAETGVVGFLLSVTIFFFVGRSIRARIFEIRAEHFAVIASFLASLAGLAVHATLDFPLRIPAIAVLATIMCSAALRATLQQQSISMGNQKLNRKQLLGAVGVLAVVIALMLVVALQPQSPYPYNLTAPQNSRQMFNLLLAHPVNSRVHVTLVGYTNMDVSQDVAIEELHTTVILEPNNPVTRDLYVQALARRNQNEAALREMTVSVFNAPSSSDHFYLNSNWTPRLTSAERGAIERGLRDAVTRDFEGSITTLGDYYEELGEWQKAGDLYTQKARATLGLEQKAQLLGDAGYAFAKVGDYQQAESALNEAIGLCPNDPIAYEHLALDVQVPNHEFDKARSTLNQGVRAGADSARLYVKLAEVSRIANDRSGEEEALKQAADAQPNNFQIIYSVGAAYLNDGHVDEAVLWLRKATQVDPASGDALFTLAQAEESAYQFFAAQSDYAKALALEPDNLVIKSRFQQFKDRIAANSKTN